MTADPVTGLDLSDLPTDVTSVWDYQKDWLHGATRKHTEKIARSTTDDTPQIQSLCEKLHLTDDVHEPERIGAAYRLAEIASQPHALSTLSEALFSERESARRAAMFGLVAAGTVATPTLLRATESASKWVRKAGLFALGESGLLNEEVRNKLTNTLLEDPSVYVRSVAASAIGCFGRRAVAEGSSSLLCGVAEAIVKSLDQESNRLSMDRAQNRSIKFVRPTDACDVCEGIGFDYGHDRFEPVRSAVRENVLWSAVILCSHGPNVFGEQLDPFLDSLCNVVRTDKNLFCVGSAMDALTRLSWLPSSDIEDRTASEIRQRLPEVFASSPIRCDDSLSRAGISILELLESRKRDADEAASLPEYDVKR